MFEKGYVGKVLIATIINESKEQHRKNCRNFISTNKNLDPYCNEVVYYL